MRQVLFVLLMGVAVGTGCADEDCLPPVSSDATPPVIHLAVTYTDPASGERIRRVLPDTTARELEVPPGTPIRVEYAARDPEGMRRVQLGVAYQQVSGGGVVRRSPVIEPVEAPCPRAALQGTWRVSLSDDDRSLSLGVVAENWAGVHVGTPTHRIVLKTNGP